MKKMFEIFITGLLGVCTACQHSVPVPPSAADMEGPEEVAAVEPDVREKMVENIQRRQAARQQLNKAAALYGEGKLLEAQYALLPLMGKGVLDEEVEWLAKEIEKRRTEEDKSLSEEVSEQKALYDVDRRLRLPKTYGQTVTISPRTRPLEVPPGPMEELVGQKVTMHLDDAAVRDIIMELSRIDGLNIIADKALTESGGGGEEEGGEEPATLTIHVNDVPLKEIMSYIARNMGIAFHMSENVVWVTASDEPAGSGQGPELETRIFRLRRGFVPTVSGGGGGFSRGGGGDSFSGGGTEDDELMQALDGFLVDSPAGALYRIFKHRNVLIVRNTRENLRMVEELIRELDREPLQVLIEARFVTISQDDLFEIGVDINEFDLDGRDPDDESTIMTLNASSVFAALRNPTLGGNIQATGIIGNHTYRAMLHALDQKSSSQTLSAPRITVLNNQTARIRRGDTIRYYEEYDVRFDENETGQDDSGVVPTGDVQELEVGISLNVKVNVGNDARRISMALISELSDFLGFETFGSGGSGDDAGTSGAKLPRTSENSLSTSVVVDSGETVVLGGMITNTKEETVHKVPLLGDLPLIGYLFRHYVDASNPRHLIIFVTASIVSPSGEFVRVPESELEEN